MASIYGLVIGTLLSGSFAVEIITTWPGLGSLMLNALRARDVYLVAGCAAAGSVFLAVGTLLSDARARGRRSEGHRVTSRPGAAILLVAALSALAAPLLAPHSNDHRFPEPAERSADGHSRARRGRRLACAVHLSVHAGSASSSSRTKRHRSSPVPLRWFAGRHAGSVERRRTGAAAPARRRQLRPRRVQPPALRRAAVARPGAGGRPRRHAHRRVLRAASPATSAARWTRS